MSIKLSDGEITANKDILMARSTYFSLLCQAKYLLLAIKTGVFDMCHHCHCSGSEAIMGKIIRFLFSGSLQLGEFSLDKLLNCIICT